MPTHFIHPYTPAWKTEFAALRDRLMLALEGLAVHIEHVGSTAIPGLPAKPILDIDIIIEDKTLLGPISARLEKLGYTNRGDQGIEGRFAFRPSSDDTPDTPDQRTWTSHHLYVCYHDSLALRNHLLFRDALLADASLVNRYAALKQRLVQEEGMTREEYTRRKTEFILAVLAGLGLDDASLQAIERANR